MPQLTQLQSSLLEELAQAALIYQTSHTREELTLLSDLFAEALKDEADWPVIAKAFVLHRKRSKRFPTPAHIVELLPECHAKPAQREFAENTGKITPGYGRMMFERWMTARRGDPASKILSDIIAQGDETL